MCFFLFLVLVAYQVFVPPVTGLANNSDFAYILGKVCRMCPADRELQDKIYLVTDYFVDPGILHLRFRPYVHRSAAGNGGRKPSRPFTGAKNLDLRALAACAYGAVALLEGFRHPVIR